MKIPQECVCVWIGKLRRIKLQYLFIRCAWRRECVCVWFFWNPYINFKNSWCGLLGFFWWNFIEMCRSIWYGWFFSQHFLWPFLKKAMYSKKCWEKGYSSVESTTAYLKKKLFDVFMIFVWGGNWKSKINEWMNKRIKMYVWTPQYFNMLPNKTGVIFICMFIVSILFTFFFIYDFYAMNIMGTRALARQCFNAILLPTTTYTHTYVIDDQIQTEKRERDREREREIWASHSTDEKFVFNTYIQIQRERVSVMTKMSVFTIE